MVDASLYRWLNLIHAWYINDDTEDKVCSVNLLLIYRPFKFWSQSAFVESECPSDVIVFFASYLSGVLFLLQGWVSTVIPLVPLLY